MGEGLILSCTNKISLCDCKNHTLSLLPPPLPSPPPSTLHPPHTHTHTQADNCLPPNKEVLEALKTIAELKPYMKKLMPFVQYTKVTPSCSKPVCKASMTAMLQYCCHVPRSDWRRRGRKLSTSLSPLMRRPPLREASTTSFDH